MQSVLEIEDVALREVVQFLILNYVICQAWTQII